MPLDSRYPTQIPAVNAVLETLHKEVRNVVGDQFVGLYLHGSLALGDFDPETSDIDFVVVTRERVSDQTYQALQAMHANLLADCPTKWASELEGAYIALCDLRRYDPANAQRPYIERGDVLRYQPDDVGWVIQRYVLREYGVVVSGPDLWTLIDPISTGELKQAVQELIATWWVPQLVDVSHLKSSGYRFYAILTMCRVLYTMQEEKVVSKPVAADWALQRLEERWQRLVRRALSFPQDPLEDTLEETQAFIRYTVERITQHSREI